MLVVLDTNVFQADVRADRSLFRALLDTAVPRGLLELFVPEVVLQELDKRFAQRTKRVVRKVNEALREHSNEIKELGLVGPAAMIPDPEDVARYRESLEKRLRNAGVEILPLPADLSPALAWSVTRRKPFKQSGEGMPDAAIWLSVMELAATRDDEIVFVTSNRKDFGRRDDPHALAHELLDDLRERGIPEDRIRLLPHVAALIEELGDGLKPAPERAQALLNAGVMTAPIERTLLFAELSSQVLDLGVPLDDDPRVTSVDLQDVEVVSAKELPGGDLVIEAAADVEVSVDLYIYKADYYGLDDEDALYSVSDPDFNKSYVEAESTVSLEVRLMITTDSSGDEVDVELVSVNLAPFEVLWRGTRGRARDELDRALRDACEGVKVEGYSPPEAIESDVEKATVHTLRTSGQAKVLEVVESDGEVHVGHFELRADADVDWVVTAPSSFDIEAFAGLALNKESGAPILQDVDSFAPVIVTFNGSWDAERGWHDIRIDECRLEEAEAERRSSQLTASEILLEDLASQHEPDGDAAGE